MPTVRIALIALMLGLSLFHFDLRKGHNLARLSIRSTCFTARTDRLAIQLLTCSSHGPLDPLVVLKGDEPEPLVPIGLPVKHDVSVHDIAKLGEERLEAGVGHARGQAADKYLLRLDVFRPGDGSFRVDLSVFCRSASCPYENHGKNKQDELTILPSKTCSLAMTALTEAGSSNVKKANPLDLPVGSRMIELEATLPN